MPRPLCCALSCLSRVQAKVLSINQDLATTLPPGERLQPSDGRVRVSTLHLQFRECTMNHLQRLTPLFENHYI